MKTYLQRVKNACDVLKLSFEEVRWEDDKKIIVYVKDYGFGSDTGTKYAFNFEGEMIKKPERYYTSYVS